MSVDIQGVELKEGDEVIVAFEVKRLFKDVNGNHYARLRVVDHTGKNRVFDFDVHADLTHF